MFKITCDSCKEKVEVGDACILEVIIGESVYGDHVIDAMEYQLALCPDCYEKKYNMFRTLCTSMDMVEDDVDWCEISNLTGYVEQDKEEVKRFINKRRVKVE